MGSLGLNIPVPLRVSLFLRIFWGALLGLSLGFLGLKSETAYAYANSDEAQWAIDVAEAKSRAQDFQRYEKNVTHEAQERQTAAHLVSEQRIKDEAADEKVREEYAKKQKSVDVIEADQEKEEQAFDRQKEKEEKTMEDERKHYIAKRDHYREVLEKEAFIDEAEEYGLKWDDGDNDGAGAAEEAPANGNSNNGSGN